ncbi:MAG: hypothetical protein RBS19_09735 [Bacteroidales bacterium]|nr:hypothetical protein [Bacteroidales bacterium]
MSEENNFEDVQIQEHKKFPCKNCGGFSIFEPGQHSLKCKYCGELNEIIQEDIDVVEENFEEMISEICMDDEMSINVLQIKCDACGAQSTLPENITSSNCPFCGTAIVIANESIKRIIKPKYLIPFKISKSKGQELYSKWIKSHFFAPSSLKKMANLESIVGVYTPYWTYDAQVESTYFGERGTNYTTTETRNGKQESVTKVRWSYVSGTISHFFDDVLVAASKSLPKKLANQLTNWNYSELVNYKEDFVSGFRTEIYQIDLKNGFNEAKNKMNEEIKSLIKSDIGGDQQKISKSTTQYSKITFKHILLPIWISSYRYKNKTYNFLINGQTGDICGNYPKSAWKIMGVILLIIAILAGIFWIMG